MSAIEFIKHVNERDAHGKLVLSATYPTALFDIEWYLYRKAVGKYKVVIEFEDEEGEEVALAKNYASVVEAKTSFREMIKEIESGRFDHGHA